jgi:nucleotide-binding universal stress UspA family protein
MKILLAIDGTKYGEAAANALKAFNLGDGDEIKIISVVELAMPLAIDITGGYLPDTSEMEKAASENAANVIEETKAGIAKHFGNRLSISDDVLFGSPDSRIVETAEESGTDLIVMGSHGYKSWERLLLGSVSNSVVHHAPCSVMVVRAKQED